MTEHVHFVQHRIADEGQVRTQYECRAEQGADCRQSCQRCWDSASEECECRYNDLEPDLQDMGHCVVLEWLKQSPDECYGGPEQPVRGPDWQPVTLSWYGDYFTWDYAEKTGGQ